MRHTLRQASDRRVCRVLGIARRHVTVALTGDGGEEAFGGYDFRYQPHTMEARVRKFVPGAPGRVALRLLGARWPRHQRLPRPLRLGAVLENLGRDPATAYYADLCFLKPAADHRVIELAFRLPSERKMPQLRPKHLLRELAARRLPRELSAAPKRGFTALMGEWIAGPYAESFRGDVLRSGSHASNWLDMGPVRALFDEHRARRANHSYALWAVWMLEGWAALRRSGGDLRRVEAATA